jgi:non-ribosomal peptide synthetase component F
VRFPLSFVQQRLWFIDQLVPGEPTYNMPYAMWLDGPLDPEALQRAMDALVARHAVFRTSLVALDGVPEQVVADTTMVLIQRLDLSPTLAEDERTRQADSIAVELARQPFDLAAAPLMRAALIAAEPQRHLFVLVMHHSISDGLSMKIVMDDLSALYQSETTGTPASLPALPMEYGDYAVWQHDRMQAEVLERLLGYWRKQMRGAPPVLTLPTDRPRPARQSARGAWATVTVDDATTGRLAVVARRNDATVFMVFLAGFAAVLARYARQTDIVIYTPVGGRTHTELDPLVGVFTNTVALRISLADDPTFAALIGRVRDTTLDALLHDELPLAKLVEDLAPARTLKQVPLSQVQFLYGSLNPPSLDLPGVTSRGRALCTATAKLDLTMYVDTWADQTTTLTLEYSTDLFDPPWAERFARCMAQLLEHAAQAPDTAVADLPMLSPAQRSALIGRNRPVLPAGDDNSMDLRRVLQASTSRVSGGDATVAMSQVCDRAARIAHTLADQGVGPETLVGLCLGRSAGMLAALLAVWWAGGAYVPLDVASPPARLTAMARGAGLRTILCDAAHRELAGSVAGEATVICIDDAQTVAAPPLAPVSLPAAALAYVIVTSGSTGSKSIGVEHRAVANLLAFFRHTVKLGSDDRIVAVTNLSFDMAIIELLLPVVCGCDLVIATAEEVGEPDRLRSLIERTRATVLRDAAEIGPPIDFTSVYILDERLMPVPVGVVGEVWLGGRGVARGYYNQPRLTARSFRPDPFGEEPGARMYQTGDLGRWREDMGLELVGRTDHQVKIHGLRIECGEIEAVLRAHRDIRQAVVVSVARAGEPALVAYVVPRRGSDAAQPNADMLELLRPHLHAALPGYMIPALVMAVPALPLTPTAKVDRAALPAPQWSMSPTVAGHR